MSNYNLKLVDVIKRSKKQISDIKKEELVNLLFQNKELEEISNLNDIRQSIEGECY